jgi:hypothetical protein
MERKTDNDFAAARSSRHGTVHLSVKSNHTLADLYNLEISLHACDFYFKSMLKTKIMIDINLV